MWKADASITAGVYNTKRQWVVFGPRSAGLWDSTGLTTNSRRTGDQARSRAWMDRSLFAPRECLHPNIIPVWFAANV